MTLDHLSFWKLIDTHDWPESSRLRRRNCWFVCRDGNPGVSIDEIMRWPISKVRQAVSDINYLIDRENKAAGHG